MLSWKDGIPNGIRASYLTISMKETIALSDLPSQIQW